MMLFPQLLLLLLSVLPPARSDELKPLAPVRRCYVPPVREGDGCVRMQILQGAMYGLNQYGQETSAQRLCLKKLREAVRNRICSLPGNLPDFLLLRTSL